VAWRIPAWSRRAGRTTSIVIPDPFADRLFASVGRDRFHLAFFASFCGQVLTVLFPAGIKQMAEEAVKTAAHT